MIHPKEMKQLPIATQIAMSMKFRVNYLITCTSLTHSSLISENIKETNKEKEDVTRNSCQNLPVGKCKKMLDM